MDQTLTTLIFWFPQALIQILVWTYWLQTKEYRWDRFKLLFDTKVGRENLLLTPIILKIVAALVFPGYYVFALLLIALNYYLFRRTLKRGLIRPRMTARAVLVMTQTTIGLGVALFLFQSMLVLELSILLMPIVGVVTTKFLVLIVIKRRKALAKKAVALSKAKVVAVTGSYGKTTTKKFIAQILSQKLKVKSTFKNANTPLLVFSTLKNIGNPDVFVVEMGAYRKGEIENFVEVAKPYIGIITGIEEQHMFLFGSLEKIKKVKYELISGIKSGGTAVFNLSGSNVMDLYSRAKKDRPDLKLVGYYVGSKPPVEAKYIGNIVQETKTNIKFRLSYKGKKMFFKTPLPAAFLVENVLGAIVTARELGIDWKTIRRAVTTLATYKQIMSVIKIKGGPTVIDDSKNSPPSGFVAAIDTLSKYSGKKIVVTTGTIELGKASSHIHRMIARRMLAAGVSQVYLTNKEFYTDFKAVLDGKAKLYLVCDKKGLSLLPKLRKEKATILIEGRMPSHIRMTLLEK